MAATLFTASFIFEGLDHAPRQGWGVVVENGRVLEVGPRDGLKRTWVEHVELSGTLCPGLVDAHTHVVLSPTPDPAKTLKGEPRTRTVARALKHMAQHLAAGVTTIRDLGGHDGIDLELMRAQQDGFVMGPRMLAAGTVIAMTGGHACFLGCEADGVDEIMKAVRLNLKNGAAVLKLIATGGVISPGVEQGSPQLSEAEMRAAVLEAVHAGRKVAAHAQGTEGIMNALGAGVHSIEHGFWLDEACVAKMHAQGTALVATFSAAQAMLDNLDRLPPFIRTKMEKLGDAHDRSFKMALNKGVAVVAGTDAGTPFNPHGDIAREIELHVHHGASKVRALHAATGAAGALLGRDDVGLLKAGAVADMVLLDGNPAEDLSSLRRVSHVWQDGRPVDLAKVAHVAAGLAMES